MSQFRFLAAAALIALGSCAATPDRNTGMAMADGAANHPISVEPSYRSLKLTWSPQAGGLSPAEQAQLDAFVGDYIAHGNGSIAVSAPAVVGGQEASGWFAGHINAMGVPGNRILIAAHDAGAGSMQVEVNYVSYQARTAKCGDWSDDLAFTLDNSTPRNFGCAVQQNIAAMVADPRDLIGPRSMDPDSGARRALVISNYEQGKVTQAEKHTSDSAVEQSAGASKVGQ